MIQIPDGRHFASTLALMLQFVGARFRTIIETRWVVEPGIAALAAERADAGDVAALRACLAAMRAALADSRRFTEENRRFHDLLAYASGNPCSASWSRRCTGSRSAPASSTAPTSAAHLRGMGDILAAIEARDRPWPTT